MAPERNFSQATQGLEEKSPAKKISRREGTASLLLFSFVQLLLGFAHPDLTICKNLAESEPQRVVPTGILITQKGLF